MLTAIILAIICAIVWAIVATLGWALIHGAALIERDHRNNKETL